MKTRSGRIISSNHTTPPGPKPPSKTDLIESLLTHVKSYQMKSNQIGRHERSIRGLQKRLQREIKRRDQELDLFGIFLNIPLITVRGGIVTELDDACVRNVEADIEKHKSQLKPKKAKRSESGRQAVQGIAVLSRGELLPPEIENMVTELLDL